ncbi:hypothetical protein [Desulfatibacillum alkenivorans]|jgi:hypothetical protein|nr:hypothetical protein [Desulfatibacillum alkenivorans]
MADAEIQGAGNRPAQRKKIKAVFPLRFDIGKSRARLASVAASVFLIE